MLTGGLYGSIIIKPLARLKHWEPNIPSHRDHVLIVSWAWLHNTTQCLEYVSSSSCPKGGNYSDITYKFERGTYPMAFPVHGLCEIFCRYYKEAYFNTINSGVEYDVYFRNEIIEIETFVVNAQYQPTLGVNTNEWHRLRLTNTHMSYLLYQFNVTKNGCDFDLNSTDCNNNNNNNIGEPYCQMWVISSDGIYFDDGPRAVFKAPYNDTVVIPPGGRVELLVNCLIPGEYAIYASNDTRVESFQSAPVPTQTTLIMFIEAKGLLCVFLFILSFCLLCLFVRVLYNIINNIFRSCALERIK